MNEKNRKYIDSLMELYYNISNTNNMNISNKFNAIIHSNIMELTIRNMQNNTTLAEPSTPYILGNASGINNKHDKIFRTILLDEKEAGKFIIKYFNPKTSILEKDLEIYNSSFITNEFKNQEADIVYELKNTSNFILIEHQTTIDHSMPFRILNYQLEIIRRNIQWSKINMKDYKWPVVIPIVLYTGKQKWNAKTSMTKFQNDKGGENMQPGEYILVDVNTISEEELLEEDSFISKIMLLEKSRTKEDLEKNLQKIIPRIEDKNKELMIQIIDVILKQELGEEKAQELINKLTGGESSMLACIEMLQKEENKRVRQLKLNEKHRITQIAQKLLSKSFPISEIIDITGLSKEEVEKLKQA